MMWLFGYGGLQILIFLVLLWLSWAYYDKRYRNRSPQDKSPLYSGDFIKTNEIFVDPKDGLTYQVYYNPKTGEREYVVINDK
ncbi:HD family phosphohydrolase [Paenibacillus guangzhouensis]|uniref:HD family phosphohydrolase n=1 Tax=Paenibacillus guangzhouensis TaxID=1473112 RepID=UPI0012677279|nr:HD family phosphohydrolase [Paenibacillus guangzhouensis]